MVWGLFSCPQSPYRTRNILSFTTGHTNSSQCPTSTSLERSARVGKLCPPLPAAARRVPMACDSWAFRCCNQGICSIPVVFCVPVV